MQCQNHRKIAKKILKIVMINFNFYNKRFHQKFLWKIYLVKDVKILNKVFILIIFIYSISVKDSEVVE